MNSVAVYRDVFKREIGQGQKAWGEQFSAEQVEQACQAHHYRWRNRIWTPWLTMWTFLVQVLEHTACRGTVAMTLQQHLASGRRLRASSDASAFCAARGRIPVGVFWRCMRRAADRLAQQAGPGQLWKGRRVWVVDGSSCSMPDAPGLRKRFGLPDGCKLGCGFPVAKWVAVFCWATGALVDIAIGACRQAELSLWRKLMDLLQADDIVLGDRLYCTFVDMARLRMRSCDGVFRLHQSRKLKLSAEGRLPARGNADILTTWLRPQWPGRQCGLTAKQWQRLPDQMNVRIIRFRIHQRGFRSRQLVLATTLLDRIAYPIDEIAGLYGDRWTVELRLRSIKNTLKMDVLRTTTVQMVLKEIYTHLLAYNLIRTLMWQAAVQHGVPLHRVSFAGTVQRLNATLPLLTHGHRTAAALYDQMLQQIAHDRLPHRPNRTQPRAVKRRPKDYPRMNRPRSELRKALMA